MKHSLLTRRNMLKGAAALAAAAGASGIADVAVAQDMKKESPATGPEPGESTRTQRLAWWRAARFGMFIHFGVYSTIGRHEWVMEDEAIPVAEYAPHAATFHPHAGSPRAWARRGKPTGST